MSRLGQITDAKRVGQTKSLFVVSLVVPSRRPISLAGPLLVAILDLVRAVPMVTRRRAEAAQVVFFNKRTRPHYAK